MELDAEDVVASDRRAEVEPVIGRRRDVGRFARYRIIRVNKVNQVGFAKSLVNRNFLLENETVPAHMRDDQIREGGETNDATGQNPQAARRSVFFARFEKRLES